MAGRFEERNGEKYLRVYDFSAHPIVGDMKIYATGIFPDPELSRFFFFF